jgi:hypothetical protein
MQIKYPFAHATWGSVPGVIVRVRRDVDFVLVLVLHQLVELVVGHGRDLLLLPQQTTDTKHDAKKETSLQLRRAELEPLKSTENSSA